MFNVRPKTALMIFAGAMTLLSLALLLTLGFTIPAYLKMRAMTGPQLFNSPRSYASFLEIYRLLFFTLFPSIALLCGAGGWLVLKNLKRIGN